MIAHHGKALVLESAYCSINSEDHTSYKWPCAERANQSSPHTAWGNALMLAVCSRIYCDLISSFRLSLWIKETWLIVAAAACELHSQLHFWQEHDAAVTRASAREMALMSLSTCTYKPKRFAKPCLRLSKMFNTWATHAFASTATTGMVKQQWQAQ